MKFIGMRLLNMQSGCHFFQDVPPEESSPHPNRNRTTFPRALKKNNAYRRFAPAAAFPAAHLHAYCGRSLSQERGVKRFCNPTARRFEFFFVVKKLTQERGNASSTGQNAQSRLMSRLQRANKKVSLNETNFPAFFLCIKKVRRSMYHLESHVSFWNDAVA